MQYPHDFHQDLVNRLDKLEGLIKQKDKPFLSLDETSEYLRIPRATLYGYISKSIISYHKLNNRRVYFDIDDLNKFILNSANRYRSNSEIEAEADQRAQNL